MKRGAEKTKIDATKTLLAMGILSLEQIAEAPKLSIEEIEKIKEEQR